MEDKRTISPYLNDKLMYGFGFLAGLIWLVLGSSIFIFPLIFIGEAAFDMDIMMDKVMMYQGYAASAAEIVGIAVAIIFFKKVFISDFKDFLKNWKKNVIIIIIASALIFACGYLFEFIYEFFGVETESGNQQLIEDVLFSDGKWIMIIQVAIIAPIFEEIVFRKFPFGFLNEIKLHRIISFLVVAFVFALIHCSSENFFTVDAYVYLFNYFALSAILTGSYALCKDNIYASIIVHMANNILSLLLVYGVINALI